MMTNNEILDVLADAIQSGEGVSLAVAGCSMGPSFRNVADIRVTPCRPEALGLGQLIVFQRDGMWVVHRVMGRHGSGEDRAYLTKGDGLSTLDQPVVRPAEVKGVVSRVTFVCGDTRNLLSWCWRLQAWWVVMRFWIGRFIARTGRGLGLWHRA